MVTKEKFCTNLDLLTEKLSFYFTADWAKLFFRYYSEITIKVIKKIT